MDMREVFTIDGRRFSNMAGFYDEVERVFTCGLDRKIGRNLNAFRLTTCGGDGGCNICGGLGPFLGFLPCSPHCKPEVQEDKELNGDYDFYRPIIRLENYD